MPAINSVLSVGGSLEDRAVVVLRSLEPSGAAGSPSRVVAALRAREDLTDTSQNNLKRECKRSGVQVRSVDGRIMPEPGHELAFLQMLDRRRYAICLVTGRWEQYEAASRKAAGVSTVLRPPPQRQRDER